MRTVANQLLGIFSACTIASAPCGATSITPLDRDGICASLRAEAQEEGKIHLQTRIGALKSSDTATYADVAGGTVEAYYIARRSGAAINQRAAISVKLVIDQFERQNAVGLYNNLWQPGKTGICGSVTFAAYQAYHQGGLIQSCLEYNFHNPVGHSFKTNEPISRLQTFLFPEPLLGKLASAWRSSSEPPRKRMSMIFNYSIPDSGYVCIQIKFTPAGDMKALDLYVDDLFVNEFYQTYPTLHFTAKKP